MSRGVSFTDKTEVGVLWWVGLGRRRGLHIRLRAFGVLETMRRMSNG